MMKQKKILFPVGLYLLFQLPLYFFVRVVEYDEAIYLNIARNLSSTGIANRSLGKGVLYAEHTSVYQHFVGLLHLLVGDQIFLFRFITSLFGLGILLLVWSLVNQQVGSEGALISSLIVAVNPFFNRYAFFIREEIWMCLFILLALWSIFKIELGNDNRKQIYQIALWLTLAFLTKELSLIFSLFVIPYLFMTGEKMHDRVFRAAVPSFSILAGFVLWLFWVNWIDPLRFAKVAQRWRVSVLGGKGGFSFDWGEAILWSQKIVHSILTPTFVALFLIGLVMTMIKICRSKSLDSRILFVGLFPLFAVGISLLISLKRDRHIMPILFIAAISIGLMIDWSKIFAWSRKSLINSGVALVIALLILFEMSPLQFPTQYNLVDTYFEDVYLKRLFINDRHYNVLQQAGERLSELAKDDEIIYVVNEGPVIGYYAERNYQFLYTSSFDQIINYLDRANWLVEDANTYLFLSKDEQTNLANFIQCAFEPGQPVSTEFREVRILMKKRNVEISTCLPN